MTAEHVEVRVTGQPEAVDAVLRLLRTAGGPGITGGGARGPYERGDGRVAYYAHLQVDVAAAAAAGRRPDAEQHCTAEYEGWTCELERGHDGRHTAGDGGRTNGATWLLDYERAARWLAGSGEGR